MIQKLPILVFFFFCAALSFGQEASQSENPPVYKASCGLRAGFDAGFSFKHLPGKNDLMYELLLSSRVKDFHGEKLVFIIGKQKLNTWEAITIPHLSWIYGIGGHISHYKAGAYPKAGSSSYYPTQVYPAGIDVLLATEYRFPHFPMTIALDVRPFYEFYKRGVYISDVGLSFRYIIF